MSLAFTVRTIQKRFTGVETLGMDQDLYLEIGVSLQRIKGRVDERWFTVVIGLKIVMLIQIGRKLKIYLLLICHTGEDIYRRKKL